MITNIGEYKYTIIFTLCGILIIAVLFVAAFTWINSVKDIIEQSNGSAGVSSSAPGFQFEKLEKIGIITESVSFENTASSSAVASGSAVAGATTTNKSSVATSTGR